jgi:hypothetical protein
VKSGIKDPEWLKEAEARKVATRQRLLNEADLGAIRGDSKAQELKNRLRAALLGADPADSKILSVANAIAQSERVDMRTRYEVAVLLEMLKRKTVRFADKGAWLESRKESALKLGAEFPEVSEAQDAAVAFKIAGDVGDLKELEWISKRSDISIGIKQTAEALLKRTRANNEPLRFLLRDIPGVTALLEASRLAPVALYTWRPDDAASIANAVKFAASLEKGTVVFGINLSRDVPGALQVVEKQKLPGVQLYSCRGFDSPLVEALGMETPSLTWVTDRTGKLITRAERPSQPGNGRAK